MVVVSMQAVVDVPDGRDAARIGLAQAAHVDHRICLLGHISRRRFVDALTDATTRM
jgi:hypothetical protein